MEDLDKDCEVDDDYSSKKEMNGKVSWVIDKGIWLGKKAVITGAVITSAPLVLPPLVVFSTLGLACSVPFGFVFATYACTQKIMSALLPTPESDSMLEYEKYDMEVIDLVQGSGAEGEGYDLEDVDLVQGAVEQENDELLQLVDERGYEEDEEEEADLEQAPEEQKMKDGSTEVEADNLQKKPIHTMEFDVTTEQNGGNDVLPKGAALLQEDVLYGQDDIQIYDEEPLEQEKLLDVNDTNTHMDIHKQKPVVEEKQLEAVEGAARMLELDVSDISKPERGHSYQALVYDGKNDFAVLKKDSDEMKIDIVMRSDKDGEAKNKTQERSALQENEVFALKSLEERPIKIIEHGHEGEYKEDATKYIPVEDVLSVEGTEVRNEKPIIEDMNEKAVIGIRQVIVSVHSGKKIAGEQENEDIKVCNKSQKLVLVAKRVADDTVGDIKSVVERTKASDLHSAREIADECGLDLFDYTAGGHNYYNDFNISQENDNIRSSKTGDVEDLPFLRISTKVAVSKHINLQPETDPLTPSSEGLLNEEKIWEQIDALRAIVGYSAPMHATSLEEMKALYVFTGVEPPSSLADNSDLVEMNKSLRLLKSVVGVI